MNYLAEYYQKIDAMRKLQSCFPNFVMAVVPTCEVAFLHDWLDENDIKADFNPAPFGFIFLDSYSGKFFLFSDDESERIVFHGVFDNHIDSFDYACDYCGTELFISPFFPIASQTSSTESVDN